MLYYKCARSDKIDNFIDENKALVKRMYGTFQTGQDAVFRRRKRDASEDVLDGGPNLEHFFEHESPEGGGGDSFFNKIRHARQSTTNFNRNEETGR